MRSTTTVTFNIGVIRRACELVWAGELSAKEIQAELRREFGDDAICILFDYFNDRIEK